MDESKPAAPADPNPSAAEATTQVSGKTPASARAQRLAAALRDNLRRRKTANRAAVPDKPRN